MNACDNYIVMMQTLLPDQCCPKDLVKVGLFKSRASICWAMKHNQSPAYFKLGGRVMFPKESIIEWLKERKHDATKVISNKEEMSEDFQCEASVA